MDCTKCGNPNVIIKKEQSGQYLCKDCFIESIEKKVIKTVRKEKLLDKGDKVLVALSGGKDSVTTLEILNSFREMNIIDICAVTVDEGIDNYRQDGVDIAVRHAERLGIEHKIVSLKDAYGITLDEIMERAAHQLGVDRKFFRYAGDTDISVKRICWVSGAGSEFMVSAITENCDLYITGDLKYHDAQKAHELGINVLDLGHYATENIFRRAMSSILMDAGVYDKARVELSDVDINPFSL